MELEVDVWLEMYLKIYLKSYLSFVCERIEKYLIFSINFIFIRDFAFAEISEILSVRSREIWMSEKRCGFVCNWS